MRRANAAMELWPWAGLIGAGLAWILVHQIGSDSVAYRCGGGHLRTILVGLAGLVLSAASGLASYRLWRRGGETAARRFVALLGFLFALLLSLAIVLPMIAALLLPDCLT